MAKVMALEEGSPPPNPFPEQLRPRRSLRCQSRASRRLKESVRRCRCVGQQMTLRRRSWRPSNSTSPSVSDFMLACFNPYMKTIRKG